MHVLHFPDGGCEKATECPREGGATEEEGVTSLRLAALVPHPNQVKRSRKHPRLGEPEEEPGGEEAGVVLHEPLADGDEAEGEHAC